MQGDDEVYSPPIICPRGQKNEETYRTAESCDQIAQFGGGEQVNPQTGATEKTLSTMKFIQTGWRTFQMTVGPILAAVGALTVIGLLKSAISKKDLVVAITSSMPIFTNFSSH